MSNGRKTFRKKITSPELIAQINPESKKIVDRFLKNFATKRSPKSVKVYQSNFQIFLCWVVLYADNESFVDIKKYTFLDFFDYCVTDLKWSANRFSQMHSSLSSLSNFVEMYLDEKYPNFRNSVKKIEKLPKQAVREKSIFKKEELDNLMKWLGEKNKPNEQCLLALMMASGARLSELVRFTTDMIDEDSVAFEGLFLETTKSMQVKGRGIHGKSIVRYIIKDMFLPYYKAYLPIREEIMRKNNQEHNSIFIKNDGTPATVGTIKSWMEKWDTVLDKHLYAHSIRHFWVSYLMSIGVEKQLVQEMQNWSSDQLVDIYNDTTAKDMKWKGLEKLRAALETELIQNEIDDIRKENNVKE